MVVNNNVNNVANLTDQYSRGDRNRDLLLALVNHLHTPQDILEQLTNSSDAEIAEAASLHINFAGEIGDRWYELAERIMAPKDLGQNDLLICELLEFAVIPDYFINQWIPWTKITNNIENPHIPTL